MNAPSPFATFALPVRPPTPLRQSITAAYRQDEATCLAPLITAATFTAQDRLSIRATATALVAGLRSKGQGSGIEALVQEYSLSSDEGVALMCLAEALLRIPDAATRDRLIRDKIGGGDWRSHLESGRSLFVNAATWGLVVTGKLVDGVREKGLGAALTRLLARAGEPVIRHTVDLAMRLMGEQFVMGETIGEAIRRARGPEARGFRYSYDMLGEAAATMADADRYFAQYSQAIGAIGEAASGGGVHAGPGISIKLSALHPRYSRAQADRVMAELLPRLHQLAVQAKARNIGLNIDAEEADRLELSLDLLESLALDPNLAGWDGLGFVVQAYGKRCPLVIDWIVDLARRSRRRIMVRLVKGAYWDAEIKRAQVDGLTDFPVYTRKAHTDVAYIACARKLLAARDAVFPQFATHNAQTVATIHHLAGPDFSLGDYEFQCLHGMGEALYAQVVGAAGLNRPCRIYAPVGTHETLLAYLVRRLLENGANSSFVNRIADPAVAIDDLVADPVDLVATEPQPGAPNPRIALPADLFPGRRNSGGIDLSDEAALALLGAALRDSARMEWTAQPASGGASPRPVLNPADHGDQVGTVCEALPAEAAAATARARRSGWGDVVPVERATILLRAADALQERMPVLAGLIMREAGKTVPSAIAEVREAIDFLRYYATQVREMFGPDQAPLGPVVCISPWNFPLAIFTGQVAAALAAGNPVVAKPAEETPLVAAEAVRLLHAAGVPANALQLMPGDGTIGAALVGAPETAGVIFTGSTEVARLIHRQLAGRFTPDGQPVPLIAETGGQNAMIVDSSALPEQVVADVLASAFDSAGQRCSALRVLCLQEEIADSTLAMLQGAMRELRVGRPDALNVDLGPVISVAAKDGIERHIAAMQQAGATVTRLGLSADAEKGSFVAPTLIEIVRLDQLRHEVFGPVLHVLRYRRDELDGLIASINATGYGLTCGLHTRIDETVAQVAAGVRAGNLYVNRNMIGAVVGSQPFGGRGLSGTGPKAGGPLYLRRLVSIPPAPALSGASPDPELQAFADWLDATGEIELATLARRYGKTAAIGSGSLLPGPVGEQNRYSLKPRGALLLFPISTGGLFEQMAAVLATGNHGVLANLALPATLPDAVARRFAAANSAASVALAEGGVRAARYVARALAARDGPIVSLHLAQPHRPMAYRWEWLVEEQTMSINTTAAGGNASLMMIGG